MKTIKQKFIIDESGSMLGQQATIISGFNEQLATMKDEEINGVMLEDGKTRGERVKYLVSLTKFSDTATVVYRDKPLAEVPELTKKTYTPRGWTALMDAIGATIDTAALGETDCIVTIMTDGFENKSREWKKNTIKTLIDIRQNENKWGFVYFGANQEAWQEASQIGMTTSNSITYTAANTGAAFKSMSACRSAYVTTATSGNYNVCNLTQSVDTADLVK